VESGSINLKSEAKKVLNIVGETLNAVNEGERIADSNTISRLAGILVHMQQTIPSNLMNDAFSAISLDAQNGINAAMQ
jgi:uncharacterized Fe-S center protein